jgi:(1->4)-alpha-D-glucan 1-alpha-D-glucosylmutase
MTSMSALSRRWSPADQHGWLEYTRRAPRGNTTVTNSTGPATPVATYRLQLLGHLRFAEAQALEEYLNDLGIGALYLSPFFRSRRGSTHGYDIVDHGQLDPELGTEDDFQRFAEEARSRGMGIVVDLVPNHMGIDDPHNGWWQDVLENGPCSPYAAFFDIDWSPPKEALHGKVLLANLGDQFGKILEDEQLQLIYEDQRFLIRYYQRRLPTDHRTWVPILKRVLDHLAPPLEPGHPQRWELESVITSLEHLPPRTQSDPEAIQERYREKEIARRRLAALVSVSAEIRDALATTLFEFNGRRGEPASFDRLEAFLDEQPYRLCYWRVATDEINYRRFFDVDEMAAIRVEDPEVFQGVHRKVFQFIERGWITGLRIDHADGLLDPSAYLENIRSGAIQAQHGAREKSENADGNKPAAEPAPPYLVVEKILGHNETLPKEWPVQGTTGYGFLNLLNGLFVDRRGLVDLRDGYLRFTGQTDTFSQVLFDSKRTILATSLSSELYVLSNQLMRIADQHRWSRDFTRPSLYRALRDVVASFQVYRTYIRPGVDEVRAEDRRRILEAVRAARRRNPAMSPSFFDFIASVLLLDDPAGLSDAHRAQRREFVLKFQQVTSPVAAKGLEDTAFYRFYPLASLNEVGGDLAAATATPEHFHRRIIDRQAGWPDDMSATGTHDTKRGEDFRARLNVLSETPDTWDAAVRRWQEMNTPMLRESDGAPVPDPNEEHLIYQTLVGTWPTAALDDEGRASYIDRVVNYFEKALHEAKLHSSWLSPDQEYDQAVASFVRGILAERESPFVKDLDAFVRSIADAGYLNSLAQTLVKITAPGVPDFYQGTEFWDFNLVDPDNRRPVDFRRRKETLAWLVGEGQKDVGHLARELLRKWPDERIKMFLIWRALDFRRRNIELFRGEYLPLTAEGPRHDNICAFARVLEDRWLLAIVPRMALAGWQKSTPVANGSAKGPILSWPLGRWWRETTLQLPAAAPTRWQHAITGDELDAAKPAETSATNGPSLDLGAVLECFPVALLASSPTP